MGIEGFCICVGKLTRRTPMEVAKATGRVLHDPARFKGRAEFGEGELPLLGAPPKEATPRIKKLWGEFVKEFPWLRESDRAAI